MSYDLYFWPSGTTTNPRRLADRLADEKVDGLESDERVLAFRAELLRRWPDLADKIVPWHHDLGRRRPWGRTDLADRFVGVTLSYGWESTSVLPVVAGAYGLDTYDPQSGQLVPPRSLPHDAAGLDRGGPDDVSRVAGVGGRRPRRTDASADQSLHRL